MAIYNGVNIDPGNDSLPGGTKPLFVQRLINHQRGISQGIPQPSITNITLKIINLNLISFFHGAMS